jgi:hypothetical protein
VGRLFVLELSGDRIHSMDPNGSNRKRIVANGRFPDGIAVDAKAGHIYWTKMGVPNLDDGSIERADLDSDNRRTIIPQGVTHTPKQLHLDEGARKFYRCDREGMRVMRANIDGSQVETLGRDRSRRRRRARPEPVVRRHHHRPRAQADYWSQKGPDNGEQERSFAPEAVSKEHA